MSLADIFSTPFLMCLGICLLLIGLIGMYLTQKLSDQDHKISSMMGLVSTMAEELNYVRGVIQVGMGHPHVNSSPPPSNNIQQMRETSQKNDDLIEVSDGDNSDSDSDSEDSGSDNDADSDVDNLAELNFEQHASNEILSDILNIKPPDIKTIHMMNGSLNINYGEDVDDEENIELVSDDEEEDDDSSSSSENDETPLLSNIDTSKLEEVVQLDTGSIKINPAEKVDSNSDSNLNPLEEVELKQIIVNLDVNIAEYKKMSLNQLRAISVKKGILTEVNANKLKKPELVKLLEQ